MLDASPPAKDKVPHRHRKSAMLLDAGKATPVAFRGIARRCSRDIGQPSRRSWRSFTTRTLVQRTAWMGPTSSETAEYHVSMPRRSGLTVVLTSARTAGVLIFFAPELLFCKTDARLRRQTLTRDKAEGATRHSNKF